jgi:hypothetical protein
VIRNRETTKIGKSRLEPNKPAPRQVASVTPSTYRTAQSNYRTRQSGSEVRYNAGAKQGRSRTGPVESGGYSRGVVVSASQPGNVTAAGNGGRSRQSAPARSSQRASGPSSSGNSNRSRSHASPTTSSSSGRRDSSKGRSSHRD